jgi:hypothetical protein
LTVACFSSDLKEDDKDGRHVRSNKDDLLFYVGVDALLMVKSGSHHVYAHEIILVQLANVFRRALLQGSGKGPAILTANSTVIV